MSGTIDRTPCILCKAEGSLYISIEFVASPIGSFSLAGAQMKFSGREHPVLKCNNCDLNIVGEFSGDHSSHAVFLPPEKSE